jgi:hypothetical protein
VLRLKSLRYRCRWQCQHRRSPQICIEFDDAAAADSANHKAGLASDESREPQKRAASRRERISLETSSTLMLFKHRLSLHGDSR